MVDASRQLVQDVERRFSFLLFTAERPTFLRGYCRHAVQIIVIDFLYIWICKKNIKFWTLKRKKSRNYIKQYNRVCGKKMSKYIFIGLKKRLVWGVFRYRRRYVTKTMKQVWKREEEIEISIYSAFPYTRCTLSFA